MTKRVYTGDALPVAKKIRVRVSGDAGEASTLRATIGRKYIESRPAPTVAIEDQISSLLSSMEALWNSQTSGEYQENLAQFGMDLNGDPYLDITSREPGRDFDVTFSGPYPTIDIDPFQEGANGVNEVQSLFFPVAPTSGTWSISWDPGSGAQTSLVMAFNASAEIVKLSMVEGMAGLVESDIDVTGAGTVANPFVFAFKGKYANMDLNLITADVSSLSSKTIEYGVSQTVTQNGREVQFAVVHAGPGAPANQIDLRFSADGGASWSSWVTQANVPPKQTVIQTALNSVFGDGVCTVEDCSANFGVNTPFNNLELLFKFNDDVTHDLVTIEGRLTSSPSTPVYSGNISVVRINEGGGAGNTNEKRLLMFSTDPNETFSLKYNTETSAALPSVSAANIDSALEGFTAIGAGDVTVTELTTLVGTSQFSWSLRWFLVEFTNAMAEEVVPYPIEVLWDLSGDPEHGGSVTAQVGAPITNEKHYVKYRATGGTFTITWDGFTTSALAWNASATDVKDALELYIEALGNIAVTGTGTFADPFVIEYINAKANTDVPDLTANGTSLTYTLTATIAVVTPGIVGPGEAWRVTLHNAASGTWTMTFKDKETANINFGASAGTVQTILQALTSIGSGNMTVSGAGTPASPYIVTCAGALAGVRQPKPDADNTALTNTGSTSISVTTEILQVSRGPMHWDDPFNWINPDTSAFGVPVTGDDVFIDLGDQNRQIKYGLNQSAVSLNTLRILNAFQDGAELGNARFNTSGQYWEYRGNYLQIGMQGDKLIEIGEGDGGGSPRININVGSSQSIFRVFNTGGPDLGAGDYGALNILGTHTSNVLELIEGFVAIATKSGEVSNFGLIEQFGGNLFLGRGLTVGSGSGTVLKQTGGVMKSFDATINGKAILAGA